VAKDELFEQRIEKLNRLRDKGIDPYPNSFVRSHTTVEARAILEEPAENQDASEITLAGRLVSLRSMGRLTFAVIRDGQGQIQVSFERDSMGIEKYGVLKDLDLGDFIGVKGEMYRTKTEEITLRTQELTVLTKSLRPMPEKWHGLKDVEQRYRQRYLDLISNEEVRDIFQFRSKFIFTLRSLMEERGFMEVETPVMLPVAAGAMATPFVTTHNALDRTLFLRIATELHLKRLLVGGYDKVFEIGRVFRNEGLDASHNPEFTTMESYEAYGDYESTMVMVEELLSSIAQKLLGTTVVEFRGEKIDFKPPWKRISLVEVVKEWAGIDLFSTENKTAAGLRKSMIDQGLNPAEGTSWAQMADKIIGDVVEPRLIQPTFLLDYPVEMTPLAKFKQGDGNLVERFEGFIGGMEIANAFTELNDPIEQRERFLFQEKSREEFAKEEFDRLDEDFLVAVEHGMPPTGGLGLGIDRLVMVLTGQSTIREVILFPQLRSLE